jgi:hypothetical protein
MERIWQQNIMTRIYNLPSVYRCPYNSGRWFSKDVCTLSCTASHPKIPQYFTCCCKELSHTIFLILLTWRQQVFKVNEQTWKRRNTVLTTNSFHTGFEKLWHASTCIYIAQILPPKPFPNKETDRCFHDSHISERERGGWGGWNHTNKTSYFGLNIKCTFYFIWGSNFILKLKSEYKAVLK